MAKRQTRYISKAVKEAVKRRDKDICQICGNYSEYMEWDHITPFSKGAPATVENIQQLCRKCNLKKRNKTAAECSKCGGWLSHDAKHCHHCGSKLPRNFLAKKSDYSDIKRKIRKALIIGLIIYLLYLYGTSLKF